MDITLGIQDLLKRAGFYAGALDGKFGSKSRAALNAWLASLTTAPPPAPGTSRPLPHPVAGWDFITGHLEGDDIVITNAIVTAFGGASDKMDSGETASGLSTRDNPSFLGCALPMRRDKSPVLRGSPIPKLPWRTVVVFTDPVSGKKVETQLIDEGPAKWTKHAGDLTVAAARIFDSKATANRANIPPLTIRIIGGAKFATPR